MLPIPKTIRTKQEADQLLHEIDVVRNSLYKFDNKAFVETLETQISASLASQIRAGLAQKTDIKKLLEELRARIKNLDVLRLTLAFEPTEAAIKRVYQWVEANISQEIVLDFDFDRSIIGGAVVIFRGKYGDFSVKRDFEEKIVGIKNERFFLSS